MAHIITSSPLLGGTLVRCRRRTAANLLGGWWESGTQSTGIRRHSGCVLGAQMIGIVHTEALTSRGIIRGSRKPKGYCFCSRPTPNIPTSNTGPLVPLPSAELRTHVVTADLGASAKEMTPVWDCDCPSVIPDAILNPDYAFLAPNFRILRNTTKPYSPP